MPWQLRTLLGCEGYPASIWGSHPYITPVAGDLMTSSGLHGHQAHMWFADVYAGKTPKHINIINTLNKRGIRFHLLQERDAGPSP